MENRKIAISDIHGCCKTFKTLLEKIEFSPKDELYLLGDYIDRGPDSKGVIDHIRQLQKQGHKVHCLRGNHEQMMLKAAFMENKTEHWMRNGGAATLRSFGVSDVRDIPSQYFKWLRELPFYFLVDQYILVHAGLNFQKESPLSQRYDILWIRKWHGDIDKEWLAGATIIHGHTTMGKTEIEAMLLDMENTPVLDIDNGCVFTQKEDKGRLCAFDLGNRKLYFQENVD